MHAIWENSNAQQGKTMLKQVNATIKRHVKGMLKAMLKAHEK